MPIRIVRLGTPRHPDEGLRIGTVRRPPRGVRKEDYAREDFFDIWFPELAPSTNLASFAHGQPLSRERWNIFARRYRREMQLPSAQRLLQLLAALSHQTNLAMGCYCADETRCHRTLLRQLLVEVGAAIVDEGAKPLPE